MNEENPYQTPDAQVENDEPLMQGRHGIFVGDKEVTVEKGYVGPDVCMATGKHLPGEQSKTQKFYYYPPVTTVALFVLIGSLFVQLLFVGVLIAIGIILAARKKFIIYGVTNPKLVMRKKIMMSLTWLFVVSFGCLLWYSMSNIQSDYMFVAAGLLVASIVSGLLSRNKLKVVTMDQYRCTLKGIHPKFIEYLRTGKIS